MVLKRKKSLIPHKMIQFYTQILGSNIAFQSIHNANRKWNNDVEIFVLVLLNANFLGMRI